MKNETIKRAGDKCEKWSMSINVECLNRGPKQKTHLNSIIFLNESSIFFRIVATIKR